MAADAAFLDGILRASPIVTAVVDRVGTVLWISENVVDEYGFTAAELVGSNMVEHMDPDWNTFAIESVGFALEHPGQHLGMLFRFLRRDGSGVITEVTANNQFADPAIGGLVVQIRRCDERVLLDRALDALAAGDAIEETLRLLVEVMGAEMLDASGAVLFRPGPEGFDDMVAASAARPLLEAGRDHEDAPWHRARTTSEAWFVETAELPGDLRAAAESAGFAACWCWPLGVRGLPGVHACLVLWRRLPGPPEPSCVFAADRVGRLTSLALEREHDERQLLHAARHDALTGLPNRVRFYDEVDDALAESIPGLVGLLYVDLDGFKPVNDRHGHAAGDQVLVEVARRLAGVVRPGDVVARLGGDEFAVVCPGIDAVGSLEAVADRLVRAVAAPIVLDDGTEVRIGASVGGALAPAGSCSSDELVEQADQLLYEVKSMAKGQARVAVAG